MSTHSVQNNDIKDAAQPPDTTVNQGNPFSRTQHSNEQTNERTLAVSTVVKLLGSKRSKNEYFNNQNLNLITITVTVSLLHQNIAKLYRGRPQDRFRDIDLSPGGMQFLFRFVTLHLPLEFIKGRVSVGN